MMSNKYVIFALIVVIGTALDLVTKTWAESNLASETEFERMRMREQLRDDLRPERLPYLYRTVEEEEDGMTLNEWVPHRFGAEASSPDGQRTLRATYLVNDPDYVPDRGLTRPESTTRLAPSTRLRAGQVLEIRHRQSTVVPNFYNHIYVRNPGAAWGMFAERSESFRRPFFVGVSILSILLIFFLLRTTKREQIFLILALSVIVAGALGNLVDRVRYGYVVDFIQWYVVVGGEERIWPTFNIADVWITIGVVLMFIEIIFGKNPDEEQSPSSAEEDEEAAGDSVAAKVSD